MVAKSMTKLHYGWLVVAGAFVSHLLSYGTLTVAFGIFFPFMAEALGASRGVLASAGVVTRLVSVPLAPMIGPLVDRHGPRRFMVLGVLSLAAGALVLAGAHATWQVFLGYGVIMALASATLGDLTGDATVTRWFVRRRGRALAMATMGLSTAGIVVPLPLAALIDLVGWRSSWAVVAMVVLVLGLAAALVMRRRPEDHGLAPDGEPMRAAPRPGASTPARERSLTARQAARTPAFWLLVASTNLAGLALFGVNLHLFSCMRDRGIAPATAAAIVTFLYVLHTAAKPIWGVVAERVHVRYCLASCYAGGALGVLLMMGASTAAGMVVASTVYGLTRGAQSFVTSLAWSDYFGRDAGGAIRGLASPFRFVASAAGPVVGGVLYDATGDYGAAFAVFAALFALGGLVALAARPPADVAALTPSASTP
jgi:MFS family permease